MRKSRHNRHFFCISGSFYLYVSILLLILPFRWVIAFGACATIHELFHILCARVLGIRIDCMEITPGGAKLHTEPMTALQELICSLAGPVGGLLPVLLFRIFPEMALIALLLTFYNLLPLYPADGARALRSTLRLFLPENTAKKVGQLAERVMQAILVALGLYGALVLRIGPFSFLMLSFLALRGKPEKHLANNGRTRYNKCIKN